MFGTSVPEATADINDHVWPAEHDVVPAPLNEDGDVDPVAQSTSPEFAPEFELETHWHEKSATVEGREMFVEGIATVIASGRPKLS